MKTTILKIKPMKQTKSGFCGPVALKMVLDFYGLNYGENYLAEILKTTREKGTDERGFRTGLKKIKLKFVINSGASSEDIKFYLKKKIPVIVDWFSEDEGHYSAIVAATKNHIFLADPEIGKVRKMDLKTFERVWFDFPGEKIRKPSDLILRWLMAVYPPKN